MKRILIIIAILMIAGNVFAGTYYIRTDGNDANDGSANDAAHAWLTLGKAWNTLNTAGGTHTINIAAGNYYSEVYKAGGAALTLN